MEITVPAGEGPTRPDTLRSPGPRGERPYFEFEVEKVATRDPNSPTPVYPEILRKRGIAGEVRAEFVVDTSGWYEKGSLKVRRSTHEQFTSALSAALPQMRFSPAEIGGRKVRQLVAQTFNFALMVHE